MEESRLGTNTIGLDGREVKEMAMHLLNKFTPKESVQQIKTQAIKEKDILRTFIAQRLLTPVNGYSKFRISNTDYILADDKGLNNESLPWANEDVKIIVYEESERPIKYGLIERTEKVLSDWSWKKNT